MLSNTFGTMTYVFESDVLSSPKTSSPPGQAQKPNSFLFRTSSRSSVKPTGKHTRTRPHAPTHTHPPQLCSFYSPIKLLLLCFWLGTTFTLGESGRSESRTTLRSPKEERKDLTQLRKVSPAAAPLLCHVFISDWWITEDVFTAELRSKSWSP